MTTQLQIEAATTGAWEIDSTHTNVGFVVRHLMISNVRGRFTRFSGIAQIGETPETSSVEVEIDAASIDTGVADRDAHLRSADFFDIERFPTLRYRSTRVERTGEDRFRVDGALTIRDVTRPVTLDVSHEGTITDPWSNSRAAFTARTEIDREEFGLTWNQVLETGGIAVGKRVKIEVEVEVVQRSAETAA